MIKTIVTCDKCGKENKDQTDILSVVVGASLVHAGAHPLGQRLDLCLVDREALAKLIVDWWKHK